MEQTLQELENKLQELGKKKTALIKEKAYEAAATIRDLEAEVRKKIEIIKSKQHPEH